MLAQGRQLALDKLLVLMLLAVELLGQEMDICFHKCWRKGILCQCKCRLDMSW